MLHGSHWSKAGPVAWRICAWRIGSERWNRQYAVQEALRVRGCENAASQSLERRSSWHALHLHGVLGQLRFYDEQCALERRGASVA